MSTIIYFNQDFGSKFRLISSIVYQTSSISPKLEEIQWRQKNLKWRWIPNYDVIVIFSINRWFGAIQEPTSKRIVCDSYIFIKSNILSNKNQKSLTQLSDQSSLSNEWWIIFVINFELNTFKKTKFVDEISNNYTHYSFGMSGCKSFQLYW